MGKKHQFLVLITHFHQKFQKPLKKKIFFSIYTVKEIITGMDSRMYLQGGTYHGNGSKE